MVWSYRQEIGEMTTKPSSQLGLAQYFDWFRPEVLTAVPQNTKSVLSVGCGAGRTEAELIKRGIEVVGVELNPKAAKLAQERGLTILEGDASEVDVGVTGGLYDCIIYSDILEHLPDPVAVLKRHIEYLKSGGIVYVSIPNFRHYSVFWELFVRGHVHYKDAGILDRTHIRITTRKTALDWFEKVGLVLMNYHYSIPGRRNRLISVCLFGLVREFMANQIGLVARKPGGQ